MAASFVAVPRQRNSRAENATIQAGAVPEAWAEPPAKLRQKDVDARWTQKNAEVHYGYKDHVKADAQSRLIERYAVTDASVPDSQMLEPLVEPRDGTVLCRQRRSQGGGRSDAGAETGDSPHPRAGVSQPPFERRAERKATTRSPGFARGSNTSLAT